MLGNTPFGIRVPRLLAPRDQPEEGSDRATLWESLRSFQGQNKCQRCDRPDSRHLAKKLRLWVAVLGEPFNLSIQSLDPIIKRSDLCKARQEPEPQRLRRFLGGSLREGAAGAARQSASERLHQT